MTLDEKARQILGELTVEEKIALQTGADNWHTVGVKHADLPSVITCDGPHGLRKQAEMSGIGIGHSLPAVCFPPSSKLACSFDVALAEEVGKALGDQCRAEDVALLLGPGVNVKRNSLCGRNFEYFSEDPFLTGEMASAYVCGVQSSGVGACVKHFAGNSQEYARLINDSCIDQRALHEIYLSAFQRIVQKAKPWAVMCAYNKLNGEFCSENEYLLNDVLRKEWGFDGAVISDWGAVNDRVKSLKAGLDLRMPYADSVAVANALDNGELTVQELDERVLNVIKLVLKSLERTSCQVDVEEQKALARRVSAESTVLVKNACNLLPLSSCDSLAVIGQLAQKPHFQGGGSAEVNATEVESICDALNSRGVQYSFATGYDVNSDEINQELIDQAVTVAGSCKNVILAVGLTDAIESEGFDRTSMAIPENQTAVISAVTNANPNVVVVLQCGAPVETDWLNSVKAVLVDYVGGQAEGGAIADVIFGDVNPCGRLAETWAFSHKDQSSKDFANDQNLTLYTESIFVGYRYYDTMKKPVAFPFGFGLSYTDFKYSNAVLDVESVQKGEGVTVSVDVTNVGKYDGSEVVQVYVKSLDNKYYHADKELKGFAKVFVKCGQTETVTVRLDSDAFAYYDVAKKQFVVDGGKYQILICRNVCQVEKALNFEIIGDNGSVDVSAENGAYYAYSDFAPTAEQFANIYGKIPDYSRSKKSLHTANSTFEDIKDRLVGRIITSKVLKAMKEGQPDMVTKSLLTTPLRSMLMVEGVDGYVLDNVVAMLNGKPLGGLVKAYFRYRKNMKKINKQKNSVKGEEK